VKSTLLVVAMLAAPVAWAAPAEHETTTLVLVVASNRGATLDRPPLQYADDDGAKYREVFATLAGDDDTILLSELDRDSVRLFPRLANTTLSPTREHVAAATLRLAQRAREARQAGRRVSFYFVFAGHGDVDGGRGFLELADGIFAADDLDHLLRTVGADEAHVILDSCNSFFVINPRKPGGRRFATPRDAAESLAKRLPNVGVFLSTSAESEVFEWSELQSGVFSHAVRSGLLGAADADRDFVDTATAEIKNPSYRPKIFARGPNGDDGHTLFDLSHAHALVVRIDDRASVRLSARDSDGLRWLDAHEEAGQPLVLYLPRVLSGRVEIDRLSADGTIEARHALPDTLDRPLALSGVAPEPVQSTTRGGQEIFRGLFVRPFGPHALAAYREERARIPEPVYGISREDAVRMGLLLEQLGASERHERQSMAGLNIALAGVYGAYFGLASRASGLERGERASLAFSGVLLTGLSLSLGLARLLHVPERERMFEDYRVQMTKPDADQARIAANVESRLLEIQKDERRRRTWSLVAGYLGTAAVAGLAVANEYSNSSPNYRLLERGFILGVGGMLLGVTLKTQLSTSATDKLIELWRKDPTRPSFDLAIVPAPGGGLLGLSGRF
jgi:hypothetical protein